MAAELFGVHHDHHIKMEWDGGKLKVMKVFHNKKALQQNQLMRDMKVMHKGKLGLHDDADIRFGISVPSTLEWSLFKRKYPDIYAGLKSRDESERIKACRRLQQIEPEWVVQERL